MIIDTRGVDNRNYWSCKIYEDEHKNPIVNQPYNTSYCLSKITSVLYNYFLEDDKKCSFLFYDLTLHFNYQKFKDTSNIMHLTLDEYKRYLSLIQELYPFDYKISFSESLENGYKINLKFSGNYTQFMFVLTLVRYGYENPASHYMPEVMMLYDYLTEIDSSVSIIDCIHIVFGYSKVTHNHETQTIFPYLSNGIPILIHKKNMLNRLATLQLLVQIFSSRSCSKVSQINQQYKYNTDEFAENFKKHLPYYLNLYNKWK